MSGPDRQRVLFIGGLGRSGSTLIEKLLNEFPSAAGIGETVHLWERGVRDHERCGCGEPFPDCPFWTAVGSEAFGGWSEIDLDRAIELRWSVDRSRQLPEMVRSHRRGFSSSFQQEYLDLIVPVLLGAGRVAKSMLDADLIIDSSKHLSAAALYSLDPRLDVRVLHVLRDPRGVAYSWTKAVTRPEADASDMPRYRPTRTAGRWVTDNLGFERLSALGVSMLRLRYEDFVADPLGSLGEIATFAGLPETALDRAVFDGAGGRLTTPMHSVAGNPLRFGGDDIAIRLDDAWRTELPVRQRRIVGAITAPARRRFGYA